MQEFIGASLLALRAATSLKFASRLGTGFTVKLLVAAVAVALLIPLTSSKAQAPSSEDPNWPCIQRKIPEISPGMMWAGPPIGKLGNAWREDPEINRLASKIASRSMAIEDAKKLIENFASGLGADRNRKLTMLFASILQSTNLDRTSIIAGIERYARRQRALADKLERQTAELSQLSPASSDAEQSRRSELEVHQLWDARIFMERERSLIYICEQPVLLEQRIFSLGREFMMYLD